MECSGTGMKFSTIQIIISKESIYCIAPDVPLSQSLERQVSSGEWEMIFKIRILCAMTAKRKSSIAKKLSRNQTNQIKFRTKKFNHKIRSSKLMIQLLRFKFKIKSKKLIKSILLHLLLIDHKRLNIWRRN